MPAPAPLPPKRLPLVALLLIPLARPAWGQSVARVWDEQALDAIRIDKARPPVHARNLWHLSAAMYDAWAAYDPTGAGFLDREKLSGTPAAQAEAVSYAAYRVLNDRYALSPNAASSLAAFSTQMTALGYDPSITTTVGNSPAAVGNRVAAKVIAYGLADGSNQQHNYADTTGYAPVNATLDVTSHGAGPVADPSRWQPLKFEGEPGQHFLAPQWGDVTPFGLTRPSPGAAYGSDLAPAPPAFGSQEYKDAAVQVIEFSGRLDAADGRVIDISPGARGNNTLGTNDGAGRSVNPKTGLPYAPELVPQGDYGRVLAEFWADGPKSETPPGHWNTIANAASDLIAQKRVGGTGPVVSDLEYDAKLYFALNAAVSDAAIASWDQKLKTDYARPITMIRHMADLGQSSDPALPHYDPNGLPLKPGVVELVTAETAAPGGRHAGLAPGTIAIRAWKGHPDDPATEASGVGWIDARDWLPYQKTTFATPPFPGYVSGHSTFSRAAAEILAAYTGDDYFPGGLGEFVFNAGAGLGVEAGPTQEVTLEWATYFDASDEAGLSRLYGGIHVRADDFAGRLIGSRIGLDDYALAARYFDGTVPEPTALLPLAAGLVLLRRRVK